MKHLTSIIIIIAALASLADPACAETKRSVVVLKDGQTITGKVTIFSDTVLIEVETEDGKTGWKVQLAAESIERIEDLDAKKPPSRKAAVVLKDGRTLKGDVLVEATRVTVTGAHGAVIVSRDEVDRIQPIQPKAPRVAVDADLGLSLRIPNGWNTDTAGAVGERLRLVHDSAQVWVQVLVRTAPARSEAAAVRRALRHDLSPAAQVVARSGRSGFEVRDETRAWAQSKTLSVFGVVELRGEVLVWIRGLVHSGDDELKEARAEAVKLIDRARWVGSGLARDKRLFRDPALRVLVEAPPGFRLRTSKEPGVRIEVHHPIQKDSTLKLWTGDDPDLRAALQDQLEEDSAKEAWVQVEGTKLLRTWSATERAVAWRRNQRTIVVVARSKRGRILSQLTGGVAILDPEAISKQATRASALAEHRARARAEQVPQKALRELATVLEAFGEDPEALSLRIGVLRRVGEAKKPDVISALDTLWVATGAAWLAPELSGALLEQARELEDQPKRYEAAARAYTRAVEVYPDDQAVQEALGFLLQGAEQAFAKGLLPTTWARLARAREVAGPTEDVDSKERALRLKAAERFLKESKPDAARRQARRAWVLGAKAAKVDSVYARAEQLQIRLERAASRKRKARSGSFSFGVPPTRGSRRSRFIKPTAFVRTSRRSRRVRNAPSRRSRRFTRRSRGDRRGRRVRPRSRRRGSRVRSNGGLAFN